jgi:hypothetical protein
LSTLETVGRYAGTYDGRGSNQAGEAFVARLEVAPIVLGRGIAFSFATTGAKGIVLYRQYGLLARGETGRLVFCSIDDQGPRLHQLQLRREGPENGSEHTFHFGRGEPDDRTLFRLEVAIDLFPPAELGYRFSWGLPGGEFGPRLAVKVRRL